MFSKAYTVTTDFDITHDITYLTQGCNQYTHGGESVTVGKLDSSVLRVYPAFGYVSLPAYTA